MSVTARRRDVDYSQRTAISCRSWVDGKTSIQPLRYHENASVITKISSCPWSSRHFRLPRTARSYGLTPKIAEHSRWHLRLPAPSYVERCRLFSRRVRMLTFERATIAPVMSSPEVCRPLDRSGRALLLTTLRQPNRFRRPNQQRFIVT